MARRQARHSQSHTAGKVVGGIDLVTGRREKSEAHADRPLTAWGLAVAISLLFCLPLGGAFLSKFDTSKFFWTSSFAWLAMAAYAIPILVAGIAWLKDGRKADALKSLLLARTTGHSRPR
jgi:ABC-type Fe3+ transport system permease subunit